MRNLEFMWKDNESGRNGCPALYSTKPEGYFVVGRRVAAEERAQVDQLADDEEVVFVPANVLDRLKGLG